MARSIAHLVAALTVACLLVATARPASAAVTCGQVVGFLSPCISYARGSGAMTAGCCKGVSGLNSAATTTPDRQTACGCLKRLASSTAGIKPALVAGIPSKCGVSIPYAISTSTDCTKVR